MAISRSGPVCLTGIGGWEHEILDSCFYPRGGLESVRKLAFYATRFDFAEVRATFWDDAISVRDVGEWISAVSGNRKFEFSLRLHSNFTHRRSITPKATRGVRSLLHELGRHSRLAGLLAQFPYSFTNTTANRFHLVKLGEVFSGFPVFVELRHSSWDSRSLTEFLEGSGLFPVNTDLPRLKQYMPLRSDVVGDVAYLRLHGRNEKGWLLNGVDLRYDYLYNAREIQELKRRVARFGEKAGKICLAFNNTTGGKALANAFEMQYALTGGGLQHVPAESTRAFPFLDRVGLKETGQTLIPVGDLMRDAV